MKRFRFRLSKLENWRRLVAEERLRRHEAALAKKVAARRAVSGHDEGTRRYLEETVRALSSGSVASEILEADIAMRESRRRQRETLAEDEAEAGKAAEESLGGLIEARRELRVLERLHEERRRAWLRDVEKKMQADADEAHRSRILRSGTGPDDRLAQVPAGARGKKDGDP